MITAVAFFVGLVVFGALVFALLFVVVGIFLVRPLFAAAAAMVRVERSMARWVGVEIDPRPVAPMAGLGLRALGDAERWRHIGFLLLNVFIGTLIGNVGLLGFVIVQQTALNGGLFGTGFDPNPFRGFSIVFGLIVGAVALGAAPRIAVFVARFKAQITQWFLGVDELTAAHARVDTLSTQRDDILDAVAVERRRIERNLHDGVQQQLVAIGLDLGMAEQQLERDPDRARELITNARDKVRGSIGELRQLGRGLHPSVLADRGIDAALSAVVSGAPIPIAVDVDDDLDLPTDVAETVYFVVNEAIANVLKHANARSASVRVDRVAANVRTSIHDDGTGGVDPTRGSGIAGIRARVHAVDGTLTISSPPGGPTLIVAEIPRTPPSRCSPPHRRTEHPMSDPTTSSQTTDDRPLRTVVADDSVLLRDGIVRLLGDSGFDVVAAVGDADALLDAVTEHEPDLCVVDVRMPPTHTDEGLRAAIEIRRRAPSTAVLVLSQYVEEHYAGELLTGDVSGVGYLLKDRVIDVDDFLAALRRVADGGSAVDAEVVSQILGRSQRTSELEHLTPREREVLELMAEGLSNGAIANRLVVSAGAVEKHISNVFSKLGLQPEDGANRRVMAVLTYLRA